MSTMYSAHRRNNIKIGHENLKRVNSVCPLHAILLFTIEYKHTGLVATSTHQQIFIIVNNY